MRRPCIVISLLSTLVAASNLFAADAVPTSLIRIPESVTTVFVAETIAAQFHRFERGDDGVVLVGSHYMSIGARGPGKETSGDKRTPIGVYFVTEQLDTSRLHEKYGVTAFPLDYPNVWDRRAERDGDGIWVHGVHPDGGQRPERDTDGCIALSNEDILALAPVFRDNVTPVLVTRELTWGDAAQVETLQLQLEDRIVEWAQSAAAGDLHAYLSLYDDDFSRWGMSKGEWSSLVLQSGGLQPADIVIRDLLLLAYPEEGELYFSRFEMTVVDDGRETTSMTRLYWRRDSLGALKIVAEDVG